MSIDQSNDAPVPRKYGDPRALIANIAAGFRLALFMPVRRADFRADIDQAVYALSTLVIISALLDFVDALPTPEFNSYGIGHLAAANLAGLFALWLVAVIQRSSPALARLVVMMSAAFVTSGIVIYAIHFSLEHGLEGMAFWIASWILFCAVILWELAIAIRAFRKALDLTIGRSFAISLLYMIVVFAPVMALPHQPLWYEGAESEDVAGVDPDYRPIDVERTFYAQRPMMDALLADIELGRPGVTDLYFLGFAGYGNQDVFMKEVDAAQSLFDDRFDTDGRSIALINNRATVDDVPLANGSNLRLALAGLAERMDLDEDVLFLFLTSHGSPRGLSASFWPLNHNGINPRDLRAMLDDAGIRWRVIVVSACYSGSFIEALESEETLVMTAARKDRTSFGCSDEAEFTYFGRALIDEALRHTRSFVEAFGVASAAIAEREAEKELTPSEPQIFIGRYIRSRLGELEDRLRDPGDVAAGG